MLRKSFRAQRSRYYNTAYCGTDFNLSYVEIRTEVCVAHAAAVQHARGMRTQDTTGCREGSYEQNISGFEFMSVLDPDFELSGSNPAKHGSEFSFYDRSWFPT